MSKLLHGVPLHEWVGRMMKGEGHTKGRGTKARNPVKVIGFIAGGKLAEVHPSGHKGTEIVPLSDLLPWWTRNDDLRKKYKVEATNEEDEVLGDVANISQLNRIGFNFAESPVDRKFSTPCASPQVPEPEPVVEPLPQPEPVQTPVPALPMKPFIKPEPASAPQIPAIGIRRIIVDPNASTTWMDDLAQIKEAISHKQAADQQVLIAQRNAEEAQGIVKAYADGLASKGVTIEWDLPELPVVTSLKKTASPRARTEQDIPETSLPAVRDYRNRLIKQMVVGRTYNREDLRIMLQAEDSEAFTKLMTHTFKNHPRLHRVQGNRYQETTFSLLS